MILNYFIDIDFLFQIFQVEKVTEQNNSLSSVKTTQEKLEKEGLELDTKLAEILEQQLKLVDLNPQSSNEVDHTLAALGTRNTQNEKSDLSQ